MAYSIQTVHNLIFFIGNKQQNDFFSHDDVDMLLDFNQMAIFDKLSGRPEANKGNYPTPRSGIKQDQYQNDALNPFRKSVNFLYADTPNGVLTMPSDYVRLKRLYVQTFNNKSSDIKHSGVQILGDDLVPDRLDSQILTPSLGKPFGEWMGVNSTGQYQVQLYPNQPMAGNYTYLSRPPVPLFSYTMNGRQVVFNQATSQNLLWNDGIQLKIIMATMQILGLNTSDQTLVQLSELKQSEGPVS